MRIIHTSDWHLGQSFFTKNRIDEHQAFLTWLVNQVDEYQVDALIIAGDVFDTGTPPSYARELFNRFVVSLQPTGCRLVALAGNHDAVATLNESRALLACLNTRIVAGGNGEDQVWVLNDRNVTPGAVLCAVPFLRSRDILVSRGGLSGGEKQQALLEAISERYQQLYQRAQRLRDALSSRVPIIVTGHLTTVGASITDSVRDIYIDALNAFPVQLFPPADYIALGHIHRPQIIGGNDYIRYCGSPIPLSFDESCQPKQVNLVSFQDGLLPQVTPLRVPEMQPMRLIKGSVEEIERQLRGYAGYPSVRPVWLDIEVVADGYLTDIQEHIQALAEPLPVEVVLLRRSQETRFIGLKPLQQETLSELSVSEVFERRLALEDAPDKPRCERIRRLLKQVVGDLHYAYEERQR
ncbi:MAG: exonuclease subunit SbcD [Sodalis sp. (in: enterobacteria)]